MKTAQTTSVQTVNQQTKDTDNNLNNKHLPYLIEGAEAEFLRKKIESNKAFLPKCTNPAQYRKVQADTLYLENHILPIVLNSTMLYHQEVIKLFIKALDTAIQQECNGMLYYLPINDDYTGQPIIGIHNCRSGQEFGTPGAMEVDVVNFDGNKAPIKPINLNLNDL